MLSIRETFSLFSDDVDYSRFVIINSPPFPFFLSLSLSPGVILSYGQSVRRVSLLSYFVENYTVQRKTDITSNP